MASNISTCPATAQIKSEYIHAFDFEVFDIPATIAYFDPYSHLKYVIFAAYVWAIYYGRESMKNRPPFKLQKTLIVWNAALAIFSLLAAIRSFPETLWHLRQPDGVIKLMCSMETTNYATWYWGKLFVFSKLVELGDTAFIVLRKQKLIFLHWYHHAMTLFVAWMGAERCDPLSRLFFINAFVHTFMYSYYALKAMKFRIPKQVAMAITSLQICQLVFCSWMIYRRLSLIDTVPDCAQNSNFHFITLGVGISYVLLFGNFFVRTYLLPSKPKRA